MWSVARSFILAWALVTWVLSLRYPCLTIWSASGFSIRASSVARFASATLTSLTKSCSLFGCSSMWSMARSFILASALVSTCLSLRYPCRTISSASGFSFFLSSAARLSSTCCTSCTYASTELCRCSCVLPFVSSVFCTVSSVSCAELARLFRTPGCVRSFASSRVRSARCFSALGSIK